MFGISIWDVSVVAIYIFAILWLGWQAKKKLNPLAIILWVIDVEIKL